IALQASVFALQVRNPICTDATPMCTRAIRFAKGESVQHADISTLHAGKSVVQTCSPLCASARRCARVHLGDAGFLGVVRPCMDRLRACSGLSVTSKTFSSTTSKYAGVLTQCRR